VRESDANGNTTTGFSVNAVAGSGAISMLVDHASARKNGTGISASGVNANLLVGASTVWANGAGLVTASGGSIFTFGNNQMPDSGSFTGASFGLK
jgi:hypothetical protein